MQSMVIAAVAAALVPVAAHAQTNCPLERAHYELRGRPDVTAGFQAVPKQVHLLTKWSLHVDFAKEGDHFWWFFDWGSARYLNMISTTDVTRPGWRPSDDRSTGPLGEMHVWFADAKYNLNYKLPDQDGAAPRHIFIPDLEEAMWYTADPRRGVPTAFFDFTRCG
jgi:hypothetical protein